MFFPPACRGSHRWVPRSTPGVVAWGVSCRSCFVFVLPPPCLNGGPTVEAPRHRYGSPIVVPYWCPPAPPVWFAASPPTCPPSHFVWRKQVFGIPQFRTEATHSLELRVVGHQPRRSAVASEPASSPSTHNPGRYHRHPGEAAWPPHRPRGMLMVPGIPPPHPNI